MCDSNSEIMFSFEDKLRETDNIYTVEKTPICRRRLRSSH